MTQTQKAPAGPSSWYSDWQDQRHVQLFDARARLGRSALIRNYETFSDVRLLKERIPASRPTRLLEVGCATGEFSRYLRYRFPSVDYAGVDVSRAAIEHARRKYPEGRFGVADPARTVLENFQAAGSRGRPHLLYSKDVLHHQVDPWGFLAQLLDAAEEGVVLRTRTRDRGPTVLDPERSCQYHYDGWMPYLVLNVDELVAAVRRQHPSAELRLVRNHRVLGGRENRFLPRDCYLRETGTAETAVSLSLRTDRPGRTQISDEEEPSPVSPLRAWLKKPASLLTGR